MDFKPYHLEFSKMNEFNNDVVGSIIVFSLQLIDMPSQVSMSHPTKTNVSLLIEEHGII